MLGNSEIGFIIALPEALFISPIPLADRQVMVVFIPHKDIAHTKTDRVGSFTSKHVQAQNTENTLDHTYFIFELTPWSRNRTFEGENKHLLCKHITA